MDVGFTTKNLDALSICDRFSRALTTKPSVEEEY